MGFAVLQRKAGRKKLGLELEVFVMGFGLVLGKRRHRFAQSRAAG